MDKETRTRRAVLIVNALDNLKGQAQLDFLMALIDDEVSKEIDKLRR